MASNFGELGGRAAGDGGAGDRRGAEVDTFSMVTLVLTRSPLAGGLLSVILELLLLSREDMTLPLLEDDVAGSGRPSEVRGD